MLPDSLWIFFYGCFQSLAWLFPEIWSSWLECRQICRDWTSKAILSRSEKKLSGRPGHYSSFIFFSKPQKSLQPSDGNTMGSTYYHMNSYFKDSKKVRSISYSEIPSCQLDLILFLPKPASSYHYQVDVSISEKNQRFIYSHYILLQWKTDILRKRERCRRQMISSEAMIVS